MLIEKTIRVLAIALLAFGFLEILSWMTKSIPPCLIQVQDNEKTAYNDNDTDCPTFYVGFKIFLARFDIFMEKHDKTVVGSFTIVLALSTIGLWLSTRGLWQATCVAAEHVRIAERANIYGGLGGSVINDINDVDGPWLFASLNNLGKGAAFITRIAVAIRPIDSLPDYPEYPEGVRPGFMLGPNQPQFLAPAARAWLGVREGCAFYGRIWFTDTFDDKTERYSSFILDIDNGFTAVMNRPKYWARG